MSPTIKRLFLTLFLAVGLTLVFFNIVTITPATAQTDPCAVDAPPAACSAAADGAETAVSPLTWLQDHIADVRTTTPKEALQDAYRRVLNAAAYEFSLESEQTLIPRAQAHMIGQSEQRVDMHVEGEVMLPDNSMLSIRMDGLGLDPTPVAIVIEDGRSYLLREGEKVPTENPLGLTSPTGDYLSYLAAAKNVQPCETDSAPFATAVACYTYDIDGPAFAEHVRLQMQAQLAETPGATALGMQAGTSPLLSNISGQGKVWLDANGLPLRQKVDMRMPEVDRNYDADVSMYIDYHFDADAVAAAQAATSMLPSPEVVVNAVETSLPNLFVLVLFLAIAALLVLLRRRRWMYTFIAISVTVTMLITPILQIINVDLFYARQAHAAESTNPLTETLTVDNSADGMERPSTNTPTTAALTPQTQTAATATYQPDTYCGKGGNGDRDGDGLADDAEYCLGTNPNEADTDFDGIDDGAEVAGFTFNEQTWYSNPLLTDSNYDGQNDGSEWHVDQNGFAHSWDIDADKLPNLWDNDDDGDGVADSRDLSPLSHTKYFTYSQKTITATKTSTNTFNFNITGQYNGYIYIDMQVQPKDETHLRYGITTLDWGYDDKGQIRDMNSSTDDIRLLPMLAVDTNVVPAETLQKESNVTVMQDTNKDGYREMLIPLSLVGDGGTTEAFALRMIYGPEALSDLAQAGIRWRNARLVWMVQTKLDSENNNQVTEKNQPIHMYTEPVMRIAGWQITKSGEASNAILGTPDMQSDDRQLFQLLFALGGAYLENQHVTIADITARFNGANTPIEEKWGITTTVKVDAPLSPYSHFNEGAKDLDARIKTFLTNHYAMDEPSVVIIAGESNMGIFGQDELAQLNPPINALGANLNTIYTVKQRSLELHMRDGWNVVSGSAFSKAVFNRISQSTTTAKQALIDQYPTITNEALASLTMSFYEIWQNGRTRFMSVDGISLDKQPLSDAELYNLYHLAPSTKHNDPANITTLPGYLVEVGNFGQVGRGLILDGGPAQIQQYMQANGREARGMGFTATQAEFFGVIEQSLKSITQSTDESLDMDWGKLVNPDVGKAFESETYDKTKSSATNAVGLADTAYDTFTTAKKGLKALTKTAKTLKDISKIGVALLIFDILLQVGLFIAAGDFSPAAVAALMAGIIMSVVLFVIALNPIGAVIVAILGIVDLILLLVGVDFSLIGEATKYIAMVIHDVTVLTELDGDSIAFKDRDVGLIDNERGYVAGNRFEANEEFEGTINTASGFNLYREIIGDLSPYLKQSRVCGQFDLEGTEFPFVQTTCSPFPKYDFTGLESGATSWTYTNTLTATVKLDQYGHNQLISLNTAIEAQTINLEVSWLGRRLEFKPFFLTIPDDLDDDAQENWKPQLIYLDILPQSVAQFWQWAAEEESILTNYDPDGDGMSTQDEINARLDSKAYAILQDDLGPTASDLGFNNVDQLLAAWETPIDGQTVESRLSADDECPTGTNWPNLCDTNTMAFWLDVDSDDDGLSDKFEYDNQSALGTDFAKYDTDGDGLSDGFEHQIGTGINAKDTDGDGLTDDREVYHPTEDGTWAGGYEIELPKYGAVGPNGRYTIDVRVFSDPRSKDTDGDGMSDAAEKENGTSPTAYNRVPRVTLSGQPWAVSPTGQGAVYVGTSDRVTLTSRIDVFPPFTVSDTLTLDIPSVVLYPNETTGLNGSRSVPNTGVTWQPRWDFSHHVLQPWEYLYATTTGWSPGSLSASQAATATLTLPFNDGATTQTTELPIVVDADDPDFRLLTPAHGDLIGGGVTHYVMGGSSNDQTTWVDHIDLNLPSIGTETLTDSLNLSPWAYTWELPGDGIYDISGRSVDFVDNYSAEDSVRVMIDNTAPTVDVDLADGAVYGPPQNSSVITITLNGTASENYSGLTRVQISTDGGPWREVWTKESATADNTTYADFGAPFYQRATGATWTAKWTLPNVESVQGYHSLRVRAFDEAGNWPTPIERTIIIDVLPPTDDLVNRAYLSAYPHVPANEAHTFRGVANDVGNVPQPSRPVELAGTLDSINDATIWLGLDSIDDNNSGVNVAWIGDFNGDRRGDLLVGLPAAADGAGKVAVVYGRSGDWPVPAAQEMLADTRTSFIGLPAAGIGLQATAAGDVNGDGLADLLIGDAANNAVYLILGKNNDYGRNLRLDGPSGVHIRRLQVPAGEQIGHNIAAAGDVNGDGYDDLLIGVTGSRNAAYLLLGQSGAIWETDDVDQHAAAIINGAGSATLATAGDLDGDFHDEFAVGMNNTLYLFAGSGTFAPRAGRTIYPDTHHVDTRGSTDTHPTLTALGDVNGDNRDDAIYSDGGSQRLLLGDDTLSDGAWSTQSYNYGAGFLAAPGDVDSDGRSDILIGNGADAYLILGSDIGTAQATINGVTAAASVRYPAGADLNSDGSSDLLLVPTAAGAQAAATTADSNFDLPPTWVPNLPEQTLDTFVGDATWPAVDGADAYVNSDGICHGLTPCYTDIQTAVDATGANDLIIVQPGVYDSFTVSGSSHNNLTVRGVDPDTVFIDAGGGSYAALIENADGMRLEKMTLRNASYGVQLEDAGIGGHKDAQLAERTILDHLFIYDTTAHNIYLDRSSTITVSNSTLVRAGNHVGVNMSDQFDPTVDAGWQTETDTPHAFYDGGGLATHDDIIFYCTGGGNRICQWKRAGDSGWFTPWAPPSDLEPGSTLAAGSDGQFYVVAAPGWDDMPESPEQIDTLGQPDFIVSRFDGNLLAMPQLGQGFLEWDGSNWTNHGAGSMPEHNPRGIAENPTNGDVAIAVAGHGLYIWDGTQFTQIVAFSQASNESHFAMSVGTYDSQGNLYTFQSMENPDNPGEYFYTIEKYDGSQWTTVSEYTPGTSKVMEADDQNNIYITEDSVVTRSDGSTLSSLGSISVDGPIVEALAYDENLDKLFACTESGDIAQHDGSSWTMLPPVTAGADTLPSNSCSDLAYSGQIFASGAWYEETPEGDIEINLARWNEYDERWEPIGANELCVHGDPNWCEVEALAGGSKGLYVVGIDFNDLGDDNYTFSGQKVAHYHFSTSVYSTTLNAWHTVTPPPAIGPGASMAGSENSKLALIAGNGSDRVYTYDIATDQWDSQDTLETDDTQEPITVTASAMTLGDGWLYAIVDGGKFCSSASGEYWSCFSEGDIDESTMGIVDGGASLTYDSKFDVFYAFTGGNGSNMLRYNTQSSAWELLPSERFTPSPIKPGAGLVFIPGEEGNSLYAVEGNYTGSNKGFWRYPIPEPNKIGFENSAIVVPPGSPNADWLSLSDPMPEDVNFRVGTSSLWFNSTGRPNNGGSVPTSGADPFLDAAHDVYRMGESGADYTIGYHTYTEPVTATTDTGIQAMINTGANRVVVEPGIYEEDVYLANGVEVIGTNPDWTVIRPLSGSTADALVRAEGTTGASFSRFTLDGQDSGLDGFAATGNAAHLTLQRARIYDTNNAVSLDGSNTDLEVVHVTAAQNTNGLTATGCASIDVRNTIFAYHTGVGLSHEACADVQLHTYNLYWANTADFGVAAGAGAAELFLDPSFVDPMDHDYRTLNFSPIIDAGNPTDPAPPGAGSRADIGYVEQGRINFYVDDSYCDICTNDGLTWQIDAFDNIQDALNAAENALANLNPSIAAVPQLVVGVAAGTYSEQVTIPSHVLLLGSGAEETVIDAGGSGTAVTFDAVTHAGIRNLTVTNAETAVLITGAANSIDIRRNLFTNNTTGLSVNGRATVNLEYNTFVNNATGLQAADPGSWIAAMHNILTGTGTGAQALNGGQIFTDYNLFYNTTDFADVSAGDNDITGQDPLFAGGATPYRLRETSPAVDAASANATVPNGGGTVADLGYSELLAAPITLLLGREDLSTVMGNSGVASVEYGVSPAPDPTAAFTDTLPATWSSITLDTPGETLSYWSLDHTPLEEGLYRFYSRATDVVGNREDDKTAWYDGAFVVDSTPPTVEWLTPANGASLTAPMELRAQVSDYAAGQFSVDENDVYFEVDGQRYAATWAAEPWNEDAGAPRVFRAWISPTLGTYSNVIAGAEDKAGNTATTDSVSLTVTAVSPEDTDPPTVTVSLPAPSSWVTHTVHFAGTAADSGSGIASVEVSVDGGSTWRPATVSGSDWSLTWEGPEGQPFISYPAQVRATDRAGNVTVTPIQFTIDEVAPAGILPVTFSAEEGTHFDTATTLSLNWQPAVDASGVVTTWLAIDQISTTVPIDVVTGTTADVTFDASGDWYVHMMATDGAGNATLHHFGPWHVGITDGAFATRSQSIVIDGNVDVANNEWRLDGEYLDDDERTVDSEVTYSPAGQQAFLTTWDADHTYMAWRGGQWTLDGELWIYINSGGGGGSDLIQPLASAPDATLPFDANYAIQITDPLSGTLYEYGSGWQESALTWTFAQGGGGDTEIRLPLLGTSNLEMLAFGLGDDHNVWAIFPTTNPLNPAAGSTAPNNPSSLSALNFQTANDSSTSGWQAYHWDDVTAVTNVADNQPQAVGLALNVTSPQSPLAPWGPGSTLQYVIEINNVEADTLSGQPISLAASPAGALIHDGIEGATCSTTNPWQCTLDPLAPGQNTITLTTHLAADLSGTDELTMSAELTAVNLTPEFVTAGQVSHQIDSAPPTVTVNTPPFVGIGSTTFNGTADDGVGVGIDYVEVRPEFGSWQRAEGTEFWTAELTVSPFAQHGDTWHIDVRAVDLHGQASDPQTVSFTVDLQGPAITFDSPSQLSGSMNEITGAIIDVPDNSEAAHIKVQLDDGPWRDGALFTRNEATGEQPFLWTWNMPTEDGVTHTLRVQATDTVGNLAQSTDYDVWVDNVAPTLTVTNVLTEVAVQHYYPGYQTGDPVLTGTVTDGTEVAAISVWVEKPDGTSYQETAVLDGTTWHYTPALEDLGSYKLQVRTWDTLGNQTQTAYHLLDVMAAPDSGPNNFITPEDIPLSFEPLLDDVDIDSDNIFIDDVADPANGTATISGTTSILYAPDANFNGVDIFTYTASDGQFTDTATVTVTVLAVNDPPAISGADTITATMDEDGGTLAFHFSGVNVDDDTWEWTTDNGMGTAVISHTHGTGNVNADVAYTPELDFGGIDSFRVRVSDGEYSDEVTVEVTVTPTDDAPRAADDYVVIVPDEAGTPLTLPVLANDEEVDGQTMSLHAVGTPDAGGTAVLVGDAVLYTPTLALGETETFTYTVSDGTLTDTAVIHTGVVNGDLSGRSGDTIDATGLGSHGAITLQITIPANVAGDDGQATMVLAETAAPDEAPSTFKFAGLSFALDAYLNGAHTSPYALNAPITLEITYSDDDVADIGKGDDELMLYTWQESEWVTDGITLVEHDRNNNRLTFTIDHLTDFALFGKDATSLFLPFVVNGS